MLTGKKILMTGLTGQVRLEPLPTGWRRATRSGASRDTRHPVHASLWEAKKEGKTSEPVARRELRPQASWPICRGDFDCVIHLSRQHHAGDGRGFGMVQNAEGTGLLMQPLPGFGRRSFMSRLAVCTPITWESGAARKAETDDVSEAATPMAPQLWTHQGPASEGVGPHPFADSITLPTTIARINCAYGGAWRRGPSSGGILAGILGPAAPSVCPKSRTIHMSPNHVADMLDQLEPLAKASGRFRQFVVKLGRLRRRGGGGGHGSVHGPTGRLSSQLFEFK